MPSTRASVLISSSVIPSAKNSWSLLGLKSTNGSTAMATGSLGAVERETTKAPRMPSAMRSAAPVANRVNRGRRTVGGGGGGGGSRRRNDGCVVGRRDGALQSSRAVNRSHDATALRSARSPDPARRRFPRASTARKRAACWSAAARAPDASSARMNRSATRASYGS